MSQTATQTLVKAPQTIPPQAQSEQPGVESQMNPKPQWAPRYPGSGRLMDKVAIVTGGDSGIGRATAIAMANEGARVLIVYRSPSEEGDALETQSHVEAIGGQASLCQCDLGDPDACQEVAQTALKTYGQIDILVNNASEQHVAPDFAKIPTEQIEQTFRSNIFSMFYLTRSVLPHLKAGARIINTASVTAYHGSPKQIDYSATKGAIVAFTRSLSQELVEKGILVNAVAPGPVWTPLIVASYDPQKVAKFGQDVPMGRPGQPNEIAPSYVFLACDDASYMTGQVLHPNGGTIVNG